MSVLKEGTVTKRKTRQKRTIWRCATLCRWRETFFSTINFVPVDKRPNNPYIVHIIFYSLQKNDSKKKKKTHNNYMHFMLLCEFRASEIIGSSFGFSLFIGGGVSVLIEMVSCLVNKVLIFVHQFSSYKLIIVSKFLWCTVNGMALSRFVRDSERTRWENSYWIVIEWNYLIDIIGYEKGFVDGWKNEGKKEIIINEKKTWCAKWHSTQTE